MIKPLQSPIWLEEQNLRCPHDDPHKHHSSDLAWEIKSRGPEGQFPNTGKQLGDEEDDDGQEHVRVMPHGP